MKFTLLVGIFLFYAASSLLAQSSGKPFDPLDLMTPSSGGQDADAIKLARQWAFALAHSCKKQIEAGVTDAKAIRKKAIEDTQSEEKKLRATMMRMGLTQQQIDNGIKDDRALYLEDVEANIKAFQIKRKKT